MGPTTNAWVTIQHVDIERMNTHEISKYVLASGVYKTSEKNNMINRFMRTRLTQDPQPERGNAAVNDGKRLQMKRSM